MQCIPTGNDCQCTTGHWFRKSDGAFYDGSNWQPAPWQPGHTPDPAF